VDNQLLQYIIEQERAGYAETQIRQALIAQGRSTAEINAAFQAAQGAQLEPVIQEYVQQYARQGSTPVQVFEALTAQGYAAASVRKAIIAVFGPGTMPKDHHAAMFLIIAALVAVGGIYVLNPGGIIPVQQPTTNVMQEFSVSDQIASIVIIAREQGTETALKECQVRLRNDNRDLCTLDIAILDEKGDAICDQILDATLRDTCLMNFIDKDRAGICKRVNLKENVDTCQTLAALQRVPAT
jgi:cytochrome P450